MRVATGSVPWSRYLIAVFATLILSVFAVQMVGAAPNDNGNGGGGTPEVLAAIDALSQQMTDFEVAANARFDAIDSSLAAFEATAVGRFDETDGSLASLTTDVGDETTEIDDTLDGLLTAFADVYDWTNELANPDPFTTTATTCASYGGSGRQHWVRWIHRYFA